jgi:hypothetical protein
MKTFEQWDIDGVERTFGLRCLRQHEILAQWLATTHKPSVTIAELLTSLQNELLESADTWNEDELKCKFIAPLIRQLLVEMLVARELNATEDPLYDFYMVGRNWFFLVLDGNTYAESKQYAASDDDDILNMYSILREAQAIITRLAEQYAR